MQYARAMRIAGLVVAAALFTSLGVGCGKSGPPAAEPTDVTVATPPAAPSAPAPVRSAITVEMSAATLADECGGTAPSGPPAKGATQRKGDSPDEAGAKSKAKRRCEQTSMQLSIAAPAGTAPADISVKEVEIFDQAGVSFGKLRASAPRVWSPEGVYVDWDQKIAPGSELSVSYALTEPAWARVEDRFNKMFVVKAVISIAGTDHAVQTNVEVKANTSPPTMVKT
jgi:hypothetical protein